MTNTEQVLNTLKLIEAGKDNMAFDLAEENALNSDGHITTGTTAVQTLHRGYRIGFVFDKKKNILSMDIANISAGSRDFWGTSLHRIELDFTAKDILEMFALLDNIVDHIKDKRHNDNVSMISQMTDVLSLTNEEYTAKYSATPVKDAVEEEINNKRKAKGE